MPKMSAPQKKTIGKVLQSAAFLMLLTLPAAAQFMGYALPQTVRVRVMNAVTAATTTPNTGGACSATANTTCSIPGLGQTTHTVDYTIGGTGALRRLRIRLEASMDGTNWFPISEDGTDLGTGGVTPGGELRATGYYPFVRVNLATMTVDSGAPTLTAIYTGPAVVPGREFGSAADTLYGRLLTQLQPANASADIEINVTPTTGGILYFRFSAATCAGSTFSVLAPAGSGGMPIGANVTVVPSTSLAAAITQQVFFIPSYPTFLLRFSYTSGCGASAATFSAFYGAWPTMQLIAGSDGAQPPVLTPVTVTTGGAIAFSPAGNTNSTLLTCAGCTTTQTIADQTNLGQRGVKVVVDMTVVGTGSITCTVHGKDSASSAYYALLTGLAITTNTTNVYTIYPGITATANQSTSDILPRTWRVQCVANNANATTYTIGASVIN